MLAKSLRRSASAKKINAGQVSSPERGSAVSSGAHLEETSVDLSEDRAESIKAFADLIVIQICPTMSDAFETIRTYSDLFGSIRMHSDAPGCVRMRSDTFGKFRKFCSENVCFRNFCEVSEKLEAWDRLRERYWPVPRRTMAFMWGTCEMPIS